VGHIKGIEKKNLDTRAIDNLYKAVRADSSVNCERENFNDDEQET
jgi:hypothetical protein